MAKNAQRKKAKAKAKEREKEYDLVDRLRRLGLRKQSAKNVAHAVTNVKGQVPDSARSALNDLISKVDDIRGHVSEKAKHAERETTGTATEGKTAKKHGKKPGKKKAAKKAKGAAK